MTIDINKKYKTKAGSEVRIYATDGAGLWPVHGAVWFKDAWEPQQWTAAGKLKSREPHLWDSWSLVEVKEKRVAYVNMYPGTTVGIAHKSRGVADRDTTGTRLACVRVEYTEGQFDD